MMIVNVTLTYNIEIMHDYVYDLFICFQLHDDDKSLFDPYMDLSDFL